MSRVQSSLPVTSKALRMPTPVITHTCLPSVTGEGDDMFCLRSMWLLSASGRFHATVCFRRSIAHNSTAPVFGAVATLRKMVSPWMIGVEPLYAGRGIFQATFLVSSFVQLKGVNGRPSRPPRPPRPCAAGGAPGGVSGAAVIGAAGASAHEALQLTGSPVSVLTPLFDGPRQLGQSAPMTTAPAAT